MAIKPYQTRTASERQHGALMADTMRRLEHDVLSAVVEAQGLPEDWHAIAQDSPTEGARDKVTMRIDRVVLRFFRSMGPDYQRRMVRVLRAWMHGRLAKVIAGPDTTDLVLRPKAVAEQLARQPFWGEDETRAAMQRFMEGYHFAQTRMVARQTGEDEWPEENLQEILLEAAMKSALGSG